MNVGICLINKQLIKKILSKNTILCVMFFNTTTTIHFLILPHIFPF